MFVYISKRTARNGNMGKASGDAGDIGHERVFR